MLTASRTAGFLGRLARRFDWLVYMGKRSAVQYLSFETLGSVGCTMYFTVAPRAPTLKIAIHVSIMLTSRQLNRRHALTFNVQYQPLYTFSNVSIVYRAPFRHNPQVAQYTDVPFPYTMSTYNLAESPHALTWIRPG